MTGTFTLTGDTMVSAFYGLRDHYGPNEVYLDVERVSTFVDVARTANQRGVALSLEAMPGTSPLRAAAERLPNAATARATFSALSGSLHATMMGLQAAGSAASREIVLGRMRGDGSAVCLDEPQHAEVQRRDCPAIWVAGLESWGRSGGTAEAQGVRSGLGGVLAGLDASIWTGSRLGLFAGYQRQTLTGARGSGSASAEAPILGAYGSADWGRFSLRTGMSYAWDDGKASRFVALPGFSDRLSSHSGSGTAQAFGEVAYRFDMSVTDRFTAALEPLAGLAGVRVASDGFAEQGGLAALAVDRSEMDTGFTTLGLRGRFGFDVGGVAVETTGTLGWRHAFGDVVPVRTMRFAGTGLFPVLGVPLDEDSLVGDLGIGAQVTQGVNLSMSYTGEVGERAHRQGVRGAFNLAF